MLSKGLDDTMLATRGNHGISHEEFDEKITMAEDHVVVHPNISMIIDNDSHFHHFEYTVYP